MKPRSGGISSEGAYQWFNKEKAKLQSRIDNLKNELKKRGEKLSQEQIKTLQKELRELEIKLKVLSAHRKRKLDNDLHKIARKLVDLLSETGHKTIYIGKNALESKNGINLGKKLNQAFVSLPFRKLLNLIKYKAQELGMKIVEVDEAFTSKTSPFANIFKVRKTKNTKLCFGERKRNLFRDFISGKLFHADLVGALNILRVGAKLLKLGFYESLKVLFVKLANPRRFKLIDFFYKVSSESLIIAPSCLSGRVNAIGIGGSRQALEPAGVDGERLL